MDKPRFLFAISTVLCLGTACVTPLPADHTVTKPIESTNMSTQLISKNSPYSFDQTVNRVRENIEKRPLKLFAEIDHAKGAASIDLDLAPSTLFIFGNPKGGTPLMARNPKMGIILPLKMHVYRTGNDVMISYPDISAIAQTYGLDSMEHPVPNIAAMLNGLAGDIVGEK